MKYQRLTFHQRLLLVFSRQGILVSKTPTTRSARLLPVRIGWLSTTIALI